jgi:DNA-binding transcriptional MerR regulator
LGKAREAFRTIGEVADELDVPKHVLRFWETKFAQVKPMKRGGNRRYYRPEDVELLRGIRQLLHEEGYTIGGVQKVFRDNGVNYVKNYWRTAGQSGAPDARAGSALPDLAGEAADHARIAALERAKTASKRQTGKLGASVADAVPDTSARQTAASPDRLSAAHRRQLQAALAELEQCRALLEQNKADKPEAHANPSSAGNLSA